MPSFLFDISEDGVLEPGEDALELASDNAAKEQAMKAIGELMAAALPNGDDKLFEIAVRRVGGEKLVCVRLHFSTVCPVASGRHDEL